MLIKYSKQLLNYHKHFSSFNRVMSKTFLTAKFPEIAQLDPKIKSYEELHAFSIENNEKFWDTVAKTRLDWFKTFSQVKSGDFHDDAFELRWFIDGKLNASVNCVDRHYHKNPDRVALIWEKDEPNQQEYVTYEQLYKTMNQVANMLKSYGIRKGDRVVIYMPTCTMSVAAMLACARIGAVHNVVFAGFSAESLAARINDAQCKVLITANQGVRAGKKIELKKIADEALKSCPTIEKCFVYKRTDANFELAAKDVVLDEKKLNEYSTECEPESMDSEDPLFMLYTSGSTGKPKGLIHTTAGYLLQTALTHQMVFNYEPGDVFGCLADIGWITGHSYIVYGPLCNGATTVLFESSPIYPNPGRYWDTVQRLRINQLYIAPTSLRLLMTYDDEWVTKYDRSSLKILGSVGEPINHEAWKWYFELVGEKRCPIADTWWQTETGSHMITPLPSDKDAVIKPAMAMRPFLGIAAVLVDDQGKPLEKKNSHGILCIENPWPSMARTICGDHNRFLETYLRPFKGYYFTGDGALTDNDGYFQITGRVDDVVNVSGHRLGTAEIEDIINEHPTIAESAIVGYDHEIYGQAIFAYVIPKHYVHEEDAQLIDEIKKLVKSKVASYAVPQRVLITNNLPKTRSGKIMRRILRKIAENKFDDLGDLSTLAEPNVVEHIIERKKLSNRTSNNKSS